jgi:hypothetical protein
MTTPVRVSTEPPIVPDTPRERELRKQVNDLHAKMAELRDAHKARVAALEARLQAQKDHIRSFETSAMERQMAASATVKGAESRAAGYRAQMERTQREAEQNRLERQAMESRLAAGAERRKDAIICLNALLTCEDDDLTDKAWEKRMDTVVKHARRIVSAERAAILKEREKTT